MIRTSGATLRGRERITSDPEVCHEAGCIKCARIMVTVVLDNLAEGNAVDEIIQSYPTLTAEDIHAAIAYAAELAHEGIIRLPLSA